MRFITDFSNNILPFVPGDYVFLSDFVDATTVEYFQEGGPSALIDDMGIWYEPLQDVPVYGLPIWAASYYLICLSQVSPESQGDTTSCFNFMANRKAVNRFIMMKMVSWFGLTTKNYSWSGVDNRYDMTDVIVELDILENQNQQFYQGQQWTEFRQHLLAPLTLEPRWWGGKHQITNNVQCTNYRLDHAWQDGIKDLFLPTAVSLISESKAFEKTSTITEKSLYAIQALTLPLWVGCYKNATTWRSMGFDVFDDYIDHSYEDKPTLIERCFYAFESNLRLLQDLQYASSVRNQCLERLLSNRKKLQQGELFSISRQWVDAWPTQMRRFGASLIDNYQYGIDLPSFD